MVERGDNGLRIDNVLSTQPELGPSIPDGGYGWLVFVISVIIQTIIPSLSTAFGIYLMFSRLEHTTPSYQLMWDDNFLYVPLFFAASWTFTDPWARVLIKNSSWPRLVGFAGTSLTCAGVLFIWLGVTNVTKVTLFIFAGIFAGSGASILTCQTEILLAQYFNLKLPSINNMIQASVALGFVMSPYIIGNNVIKFGLPHVLIWHQAIILQGIILCIVFKKPHYLKSKRKTYQHVMGTPDDEEDIFTRNSRELQIKRQTSNDTQVTVIAQTHTINNNEAGTSSLENNTTTKVQWVKFDDEDKGNKEVKRNTVDTTDLERIEKFEDDFVETPRPLFTDLQINNNTTYSYDLVGNFESHEPTVFMPVQPQNRNKLQENINYLRQPTFYKSLLMIVTTKFSLFTFFTLFPSYLYIRVERLKLHHATFLIGSLAISGLLFTSVSIWINVYSKKRALFLCIFCWLGSIGFFLLSDTQDESLLLVGGTIIILSINALQYIGGPLLGLTIRGESTESHKILSMLSGAAFLIFLIINFSFIDCFRLMSTLQFVTGALWLGNFIYKRTRTNVIS